MLAIRRAEQWLLNHNLPRLQMALILGITGLSAALFSFLMLHAGLDAMGLRYPAAVAMAYGVFLVLLRVWLSYQSNQNSPFDSVDALDVADFGGELGRSASGSWDSSGASLKSVDTRVGDFDLDEWVLLIIAGLAVCAGGFVCLYLVWTAPALLAEIMVDGLVMGRIYQRLKKTSPTDWLRGALRLTWLPALALAFFFGLAGLALQSLVPEARSIGPAVSHLTQRNR